MGIVRLAQGALHVPPILHQDWYFMTAMRPLGFRDYIRSNGFHTVYLLKPVQGIPVKIGISEDPLRRIATIQASHFDELVFHRFWWLPGLAVAARIESAFKSSFSQYNVRGEWFDMKPETAEEQVEAAIKGLNIWSLTQSEMERLFEDWMYKKWDLPRHAPSPIAGTPPRKDEPWQRRPKRSREPYKPQCPWERRKP